MEKRENDSKLFAEKERDEKLKRDLNE